MNAKCWASAFLLLSAMWSGCAVDVVTDEAELAGLDIPADNTPEDEAYDVEVGLEGDGADDEADDFEVLEFTHSSDPSSRYASSGPHSTTSQSGGRSCTIYRPSTLTSNHPVILWGNGTGASPTTYARGLRHWASHGFVVAAANTSNAGTGSAMLGCLDWLTSSTLRSRLNLLRVGTSGHSQGGGGSIMAGQDRRITATAPIQPYTLGLGHRTTSQSRQNGPMLLLSGSRDTLAGPTLNQSPVFRRANVPVFWANRRGACHFEPTGNFGDYRGITTAWFLATLRDDANARSLFYGSCSMCSASGWSVQRKGF